MLSFHQIYVKMCDVYLIYMQDMFYICDIIYEQCISSV